LQLGAGKIGARDFEAFGVRAREQVAGAASEVEPRPAALDVAADHPFEVGPGKRAVPGGVEDVGEFFAVGFHSTWISHD
jgi:hypothetical protein